MISKETCEKILERLEAEASLLRKQVAEHKPIQDFGDDVEGTDLSEEADQVEEEVTQLAIIQAFKNRLEEVENAINKIKSGKCGICEKCGQEIDISTLEQTPTVRFCKSCQGS